jgi:uncharacterized integral membrane protein
MERYVKIGIMVRLIGLIIILVVILLFIGFNLDNRCNIDYWFGEGHEIKDVPVFLTVFASFLLGMLASLPLAISFRWRRRKAIQGKMKRPGRGGASLPGETAQESEFPEEAVKGEVG